MGVRFECPQGHKLNVMAELAGKRGICPQCGARFVVPAFSGERVEAIDAAAPSPADASPSTMAATGTIEADTAAPAANALQTPAAAITPASVAALPPVAATITAEEALPAPDSIAWYVRPPAGGQYGPVSEELFQQWASEGRVSADSWVWRTGWPDWKAAREVVSQVAPPAPPLAASTLPTAALSGASQLPLTTAIAPAAESASPHQEKSPAETRRAEIRRRKRRMLTISVVLGVLALVMAVILIVVLSRPSKAAPFAMRNLPAAAGLWLAN